MKWIILLFTIWGCNQSGQLTTPNTQTFNIDPQVSSIRALNTAVANGVSKATIEIVLRYSDGTPLVGVAPQFSASDTRATNQYEICSPTNNDGISICYMTSTYAEDKTLELTYPITKIENIVKFVTGPASPLYSSIIGTGPVFADPLFSSIITIVLKDQFQNPLIGRLPTFSATGTGNTPGTCSVTNDDGIATCSLSSTAVGTKILRIETPIQMNGGNVSFIPFYNDPTIDTDPTNSTITVYPPPPLVPPTSYVANNIVEAQVLVTLVKLGNPSLAIVGVTPIISSSGTQNTISTCTPTNLDGESICSIKSTKAEPKDISLAWPIMKSGPTLNFVAGPAATNNSSINGSSISPTVANLIAYSPVQILLRDQYLNPVIGTVPTFKATDTGQTNTYSICSATNSLGISTCQLRSAKAELKTLSLFTPIAKTGGQVLFVHGSASATTSTIAGTGPVIADGAYTSTVTMTLLDLYGNPLPNQPVMFSATDTGSTNIIDCPNDTDSSGVALCTLSSEKAEVKTLQLTTPNLPTVSTTVTFIAGDPVDSESSISATSPVPIDGTTPSIVTIELRDAFQNPTSGIVPTIQVSGNNTIGTCTTSNASGISTCEVTSTQLGLKYLDLLTPFALTAPDPIEFLPEGIHLMVPIEMLDRPVSSNGALFSVRRSLTRLDPSAYEGVSTQFHFEIVASNTGGVPIDIGLFQEGLGTIDSITIPALTTQPRRFRTTFSPALTPEVYSLFLVANMNEVTIHHARIIVEQKNATKTKIYYPLVSGATPALESAVLGIGAIECSTQTSYASISAPHVNIWQRNDSLFDGTNLGQTYEFDVVANNLSVDDSSNIVLHNQTDVQNVLDSTLTFSGTTIELKTASILSDPSNNFINNRTYSVQMNTSDVNANNSGEACLYKAGIWIKLEGDDLTNAQISHRLFLAQSNLSGSGAYQEARSLIENAKWSNPEYKIAIVSEGDAYEANITQSGDDSLGMFITIDPTTNLIIPQSFTPELHQSSSWFNIPDQKRFYLSWDISSGSVNIHSAFLLIKTEQ